MGPVAPAGVANPGHAELSQQENLDLQLPSCCSGKALCVKGLAVRQIAWYQRSAERLDNWIALNGPDHDHGAERLPEEAESGTPRTRVFLVPAELGNRRRSPLHLPVIPGTRDA
jgi:hypothetical protein